MLAKVVSHLKRRFQRQDARNSQPPELRRWSGFVDPFPHVAAGGYTKYYKSHGLLDHDHPVALPERTMCDNLSPTLDISSPRRLQKRVNPRPSVPPIQIPVHAQQLSASGSSTSSSTLLSTSHPPGTNVSIPNSTVSTTSTSVSIIHRSSKMSLLGIPEGPAAATEFGKRRRSNNSHAKHAPEGTGASLRRRKRRMLRTTGEHDPVIAFSIPGMLSGAPSENDHLERPPLDTVGSNPTTPTTLCDDVDHVIPKPWMSERPDSRASFRTARSEFED
ncbi:hypothetical protein JOM56_004089 [Amanita muscaria]